MTSAREKGIPDGPGHTTAADRIKRRRIWRIGLSALCLVGAVGAFWAAQHVSRDIHARALAALETAGLDPRICLAVDGRTLVLAGEVSGALERARTTAVAGSVRGVREVIDRLTIAAPQPAPQGAVPPPAAGTGEPRRAPDAEPAEDRPESSAAAAAPAPPPPAAAAGRPAPAAWDPPCIRFGFKSARLTAAGHEALGAAAAALQAQPGLHIEIAGHADAAGPRAYNRGLSARRAAAVARFLAAAGIDPARLHPRGYGEGRPRADNRSHAGRAANRRVELVLMAPKEGVE
jgi:outer membrane protein OmpA-like peptidoglycan-associated protein